MKNKLRKYADKYFLRSNKILKAGGYNPWVNMQVFVRKGSGIDGNEIGSVGESTKRAIDIITNNSNIEKVGGRIYSKSPGSYYEPKETLMNIIAPIQEIIELETVYLGIISHAITIENDDNLVYFPKIKEQVSIIAELIYPRPLLYFGARHWNYLLDEDISKAAFDGGASDCSTDAGASTMNKSGVGTIPHALENIYAYYYGIENAVVESTKAFDKYIDPKVPRIALIDYVNRELIDSVNVATAVPNLYGVRIDTCGENYAEGAAKDHCTLNEMCKSEYYNSTGTSISSIIALRRALNKNIKIIPTSGFSNPQKVIALNKAERYYNAKLYDAIGAGFMDDVRTATADIIAVGESPDEVDFLNGQPQTKNIIHKIGRPPMINKSLRRIL